MPSKRFTEISVSALKHQSGKKQTDYYDGIERGLVLRASKKTKTWRVVFKGPDGKIKGRNIGHWPDIDVKTARSEAARIKVEEKDRVENPPTEPEPTFKEVAENYLTRVVEANGLRSASQIRGYFERVVYPEWGEKAFVSIRRKDVNDLLDKIADAGKTRKSEKPADRAADIVLAYIRQLMTWHQARTEDYTSPIVRGMNRTKPSERRRKRILADDEIRALWTSCDELGVFGGLTKLLLITAQRRAKCATMKRADVTNNIWTIRREAREKANAEKLPLPQLALDVIEAMPVVDGTEFVFPASREGRRDGPGENFGSYSAFGQGKKALDKLMEAKIGKRPQWQLHDLRRTGRSLMSRAGVRPDIAERVLGHAIAGVEGVYDRHDWTQERGQALKALAALITRITNPPARNVVAIRRRK